MQLLTVIACLIATCYGSGCPSANPKYTFIDGKCYYYDKTARTFEDALENCKDVFPGKSGQGHLFEPRTTQTNLKVHQEAKNQHGGSHFWWIGVARTGSPTDDYTYRSTGTKVRFQEKRDPWYPNQPQRNDEECVLIEPDHKWHDYPCTRRYWSICEIHW